MIEIPSEVVPARVTGVAPNSKWSGSRDEPWLGDVYALLRVLDFDVATVGIRP